MMGEMDHDSLLGHRAESVSMQWSDGLEVELFFFLTKKKVLKSMWRLRNVYKMIKIMIYYITHYCLPFGKSLKGHSFGILLTPMSRYALTRTICIECDLSIDETEKGAAVAVMIEILQLTQSSLPTSKIILCLDSSGPRCARICPSNSCF